MRERMNRWMRRRGGEGTLILLCHDLGGCLSFYENKIATVSADWLSRIRFKARQATARPEKSGKKSLVITISNIFQTSAVKWQFFW